MAQPAPSTGTHCIFVQKKGFGGGVHFEAAKTQPKEGRLRDPEQPCRRKTCRKILAMMLTRKTSSRDKTGLSPLHAQCFKTTAEMKPAYQHRYILCLHAPIWNYFIFCLFYRRQMPKVQVEMEKYTWAFFLQVAFLYRSSSINKHSRAFGGEDFAAPPCSTSLPFHFVLFASICQYKHDALSSVQQVGWWHFLMLT